MKYPLIHCHISIFVLDLRRLLPSNNSLVLYRNPDFNRLATWVRKTLVAVVGSSLSSTEAHMTYNGRQC